MKKLISALIVCIAMISCSKKSEDPHPQNNVGNNGNGTTKDTTTKIVFSTTELSFQGGQGAKVDIAISSFLKSDSAIVLTSVKGMTGTNLQSMNDKQFSLLPKSKVYAGVETLQVTLKQGSDSVTKVIKVNIGNSSQIQTFTLLSNWFDQTLTGSVGNFRINSDGTITGNKNIGFFNSAATSANYIIAENGQVLIPTTSIGSTYYSMSSNQGYLYFTDVSTNEIFDFRK